MPGLTHGDLAGVNARSQYVVNAIGAEFGKIGLKQREVLLVEDIIEVDAPAPEDRRNRRALEVFSHGIVLEVLILLRALRQRVIHAMRERGMGNVMQEPRG